MYKFCNFLCDYCYRFGASILIESIKTLHAYTQLAGNPQCHFLYNDGDMHYPPQNWTNVCMCNYYISNEIVSFYDFSEGDHCIC